MRTKELEMVESPDTILFIHGLWLTPRSWESFASRYESRGYHVLAPGWPGTEGEVEALRRDPSLFDGLDLKAVVDHYDRIIRGLDEPPIIMGHSLGGSITQILLSRGLGAAAVGFAPGTVKGVPELPLSTLRASFPVLRNPFKRGKGIPFSKKQFAYAMANTLDREASDRLWERYAVPAASGVLFDVALATISRNSPATVNFRNDDRAPALFIAFGEDNVVPPKPIRHNVRKYDQSQAITEYREFRGRPHFPGAPGWEEVADLALTWALENASARRPLVVAS
jgi:pimeloyl-ACP methyl ester carboxylesterase